MLADFTLIKDILKEEYISPGIKIILQVNFIKFNQLGKFKILR